MSNREKIILTAMVMVVTYGIYNIFFASSPKNSRLTQKKSAKEINKFVTDIATRLSDESSAKQAYILSQAKSEWPRDPFLALKPSVENDAPVQSAEIKKISEETFTYTGYLKMGERKLAIINGLEYESGDRLEKGGKIVKEISPYRVVIGPQNGNNDTILQLEESK